MVDKVTESFLNWGFNPTLVKGDYFLLSRASTDADEFPPLVTNQTLLLSGDELIKVWNNEKLIRNGKTVYGTYDFNKSTYARILGYYEEKAMEAGTIDQLQSLIQTIQEFDMEKWVRGFKKGDHTYVEWNRNKDDDWADNVEFADFSANYNYIAIDIRESTLDLNWATKCNIKKIKI
jgi:hypothetical protein